MNDDCCYLFLLPGYRSDYTTPSVFSYLPRELNCCRARKKKHLKSLFFFLVFKCCKQTCIFIVMHFCAAQWMQCYNDATLQKKRNETVMRSSGGRCKPSVHQQLSDSLPADAPQHERPTAAANDSRFLAKR